MMPIDPKIRDIIAKIDELNDTLRREHARLAEKYGFSLRKRKVVFLEQFRVRNRAFRIPAWRYVVPRSFRHLLSLPFIYAMIVPALLLDCFLSLYHLVAFPLYGIPYVKRSDYFIYDRRFLDYLNVIQKVHCLYCSYVNGLFAYAVEVAARTERYWCPVKAAQRPNQYHGWYKDFADYGNPEEWKAKFNDHHAFREAESNTKSGGEGTCDVSLRV